MAKLTKMTTTTTAIALLLALGVVSVAQAAGPMMTTGGGASSRSTSSSAPPPRPAPAPVAAPRPAPAPVAAPRPAPAPVAAPSPRGIPPEFKPHYDPRPSDPFQDALRRPIAPPPAPSAPPVRMETDGRQTTISTPIPVGRETVITPSATVTPPALKPNGQGGSIDGVGGSITAPMPGGEPKAPGSK